MGFPGRNQYSTRTHRQGYKNLGPNYRVAKAWVAGEIPKGRSHNGNFAYDGATLYSYDEPIALLCGVRDLHDKPVALVTNQKFSVTTSGHVGDAWGPLNRERYTSFHVPEIGMGEVRKQRNLDYLMSTYQDMIPTLSKCNLRTIQWRTKDYDRPWQMVERVTLDEIEQAEQAEGIIIRRGKVAEVFPYLKFETVVVEYLVREMLKKHHAGIVNFAWAMRMEIPVRDIEQDAKVIMDFRREKEMEFWRPNNVRNRNTAYAKRLFLKLL